MRVALFVCAPRVEHADGEVDVVVCNESRKTDGLSVMVRSVGFRALQMSVDR